MSSPSFARMHKPRGIAVVGASTEAARPGAQTIRALMEYGYAGHIYPVNPRYTEIGGLRCLPSLADVDGPCDVAVIALPAAQVPEVIVQCGARGIGFAVVLGGGFREVGPEGAELERKLLATARAQGVRLIGPNCLGYVNIPNRVFAGFGSITRPPLLKPGPVSAVIQSGGFGNSLVVQAAYAGIGFQTVVASGNETDIQTIELIHAFADDPDTRCILAYLEGVPDGRKFMEAARHALGAGKPLVVLKGGVTSHGLEAAASHTGCMLASHDLYRAAFRQCGVVEARDIGEAVDYLKCLVAGRLPRGRGVCVMGGSGGSAVNFCDGADEHGLTITELTPATLAVLKENLPSLGTIENPIDFTAGFVTDANVGKYRKALDAVLADPGVHQFSLLLATASGRSYVNQAHICAEAYAASDQPFVFFSCMERADAGEGPDILEAAGIPVLGTPHRVAAAMAALARYADARRDSARLVAGHQPAAHAVPALPAGSATLDEHAAKQLLAGFGVPVTRDALLTGAVDAMRLPAGMRYPVAVKVVSPDIAHKTDIGGVQLGIADEAALRVAAAAVMANARKAHPQAAIQGVLVSEMVSDGLEVIIGAVNDPVFGPVVALGLGGVLAETLRDTTWRIAPFDRVTALEMIRELRAARVFDGLRGRSRRDVDALANVLVGVSEMAWLLRDRLAELDINPVMVLAEGKGVVAADALVVLRG